MTKYFFILPLLFFLLASCFQNKQQEQNKESSGTTELDAVKEKGVAIATQMQQVLGGELKRAIEDSGVARALNYCNLNAYPLTDSIAALHGATIKRVSHKARNPNNQASEDELQIIDNFKATLEKGETAQPVVTAHENGYTFFAPIVLQSPLCLKCHGEPEKEIASEDFILINMLYPADRATGFKLNDLRGIWRIDFNKTSPAL